MIAICSFARRHSLLVALLAIGVILGAALVGSTHGFEGCLEALAVACLIGDVAMMPLLMRVASVLSRRSVARAPLLASSRLEREPGRRPSPATSPLLSLVRLQV